MNYKPVLNYCTALKIRKETDVSFLIEDFNFKERIMNGKNFDMCLFSDIMYIMCESNLTESVFKEKLYGKKIQYLIQKTLEAINKFYEGFYVKNEMLKETKT